MSEEFERVELETYVSHERKCRGYHVTGQRIRKVVYGVCNKCKAPLETFRKKRKKEEEDLALAPVMGAVH